MRIIIFSLLPFLFLNADSGVLQVDWSKIGKQIQKSSKAYPKVLTKGIKEVRLPVLLSSQYAQNSNMSVVAQKDFYSISFPIKGATVTFSGDKTYQEDISSSNQEFQKMVEGTEIEFVQEEGIMTVDFNRYGANYSMEVECLSPKKDERCSQETFLREIYNRLVVVGGRP